MNYEFRMVRPDGTIRAVHALGETTTDADGKLLRMLGTCHDVTERRQLQDEITHLAFHDSLTGLANRRLFLNRLEHALALMARTNGTCAVLFIDLDGFKNVNDSYGHDVGDTLLKELARRLQTAIRETDTVARYGGDEFAVLCEGADLEMATRAAERIEDELRRPTTTRAVDITLVGSIGIAVAGREMSAATLLQQADAAMYAAKMVDGQSHVSFLSSRDASETRAPA